MKIKLFKKYLENGLPSPESVQLEREFRASEFWSPDYDIDLGDHAAPALVISSGEHAEVFTDIESLEQHARLLSAQQTYPQAACW